MAEKPPGGNPERGWGQLLPTLFGAGVSVVNHAVNGRSSKSFIDEGRWAEVRSALRAGDYLVIQFGHNDEKADDPRRFTDAGRAYGANLERFVRESREEGVSPVLCTPIMRRRFDAEGRFYDTHGAYPAAVREVARARGVPLVDLHALTEALIVSRGVEGSKALFLWVAPGLYATCPEGRQDDTHLSVEGATEVAALFARGLEQAGIPLAARLRARPADAGIRGELRAGRPCPEE